MKKEKGIFIAEQMASTKLVSLLRNGVADAEIENGSVVVLDKLEVGEQDLYKVKTPTAATDAIYIVDGVELDSEESLAKGLDDFANKAGKPFRLRKPISGDRFSLSASMVTGSPAKGDTIEPEASKKLAKASAPTEGAVQFEVVEDWIFSGRGIKMLRLEVK